MPRNNTRAPPDPLPSEVAADDELISNAKRTSYIETAREKSKGAREERRNLKVALEVSRRTSEEGEDGGGGEGSEEERQSLEIAIEESKAVAKRRLVGQGEAMRWAIEESLVAAAADDSIDEVERAIRESLAVVEQGDERRLPSGGTEDEGEMMKRAMEESLSDNILVVNDYDIKRVIGESLDEGRSPRGEEEAMKRVIEKNLLENDTDVPVNNDNDLKRAIEESLVADLNSPIVDVAEEEEAFKRAIEESMACDIMLKSEDDAMKQAIETTMKESTLENRNKVCMLSDDNSIKQATENSLVENVNTRLLLEEEEAMKRAIMESLSAGISTHSNDVSTHHIEDSLFAMSSGDHTFKINQNTSSNEMKQELPQCNISLQVVGQEHSRDNEVNMMEASVVN